jgi:hypothetical protein
MNLQGQETITDPCSEQESFSAERFLQFLPAVLTIVPGSVLLFIFFDGWPFGIQIASSIVYSAAAFLYTFSGRGLPRYLLDCPVVQHQWDRLTMRHFGFLIALFLIETTAVKLRPKMPSSWLVAQGKNMSPFTLTLFIFCGSLLLTEVITNRSVLKRAHLEHNNSDY